MISHWHMHVPSTSGAFILVPTVVLDLWIDTAKYDFVMKYLVYPEAFLSPLPIPITISK